MQSYEYVKFIATADNKDKHVDVPVTIAEVDDGMQLINGLKTMIKCSYAYISKCNDTEPDMEKLNIAGTNIQFATAQMLATYTAFYDLQNKIIQHNKAISEKKN